MTVWQRIIIIALCVLGTMLTRFCPLSYFKKIHLKQCNIWERLCLPQALLCFWCIVFVMFSYLAETMDYRSFFLLG